jgi:DNA repair protein RadD
MPSLNATIARLGAVRLSELLGRETVELLEVLDLKNLTPSRLADLLLRQMGPEQVLLNRSLRQELFLALPKDDVERLCRLLQLEGSDPWKALGRIAFQPGQAKTEVLFSFFGAPSPRLGDEGLDRPSLIRIGPGYPLFAHQRKAYRDTIAYLSSAQPRVLLHMPTGSGKTRTALNVVCEMLRRAPDEMAVAIWLAHSEELCDQAAEEFERAWASLGNRQAEIFRHYGSQRVELDRVSGGLLVSSLQLLYRQSLSQQSDFLRLGRRTRLVIMDEAHQAVAPTYNHLLRLLVPSDATALLGLSATPGRSWLDAGEDLRLATFFNRHKVTVDAGGYGNPIEYLQEEGFLAKAEYVQLPYSPRRDLTLTSAELQELKDGYDIPERVITALAEDKTRNLLILNKVMAEADGGGRIIVFACSVQHAKTIASILELKGYRAASVTSETPSEKRQQYIASFRHGEELQILTNFGVLTTGFDAPKANVAVVTRPTQSVVLYGQMIGRVMRGPRAGGNAACRVLTVVDQLPGFRSAVDAFGFWEDIWD